MIKKGGLGVLAMLALWAIIVSNASAAATTTAAKIYTGASPGAELTTSEGFSIGLKSGTTYVFKSKVGASLTPIELVATGVSCSSCKVENKEVTSKAGKVAFGTGKALFTGVTVVTPAHCAVFSETGIEKQVITKTLNAHADFMNGTTAVAQGLPASGTSFGVLELENSGGTCAVAGLYNVTGTTFCDWFEETGSFATSHTCATSPAVETNDGGGLVIGSQVAEATGTGVATLASGKQWSIR
jgi:hypothetical protein